jgi:hypothetical protein
MDMIAEVSTIAMSIVTLHEEQIKLFPVEKSDWIKLNLPGWFSRILPSSPMCCGSSSQFTRKIGGFLL